MAVKWFKVLQWLLLSHVTSLHVKLCLRPLVRALCLHIQHLFFGRFKARANSFSPWKCIEKCCTENVLLLHMAFYGSSVQDKMSFWRTIIINQWMDKPDICSAKDCNITMSHLTRHFLITAETSQHQIAETKPRHSSKVLPHVPRLHVQHIKQNTWLNIPKYTKNIRKLLVMIIIPTIIIIGSSLAFRGPVCRIEGDLFH